MEKKFESELGKRIVEGKRRKSSVSLGVVAVAVVSFAALVAGAVFLMPAMAGAETGKPIMNEYAAITGQDDYLVYVAESDQIVHTDAVAVDEKYDVRRVINLKEMTYVSPYSASDKDYNMFVYTVNVVLRDLDNLGAADGLVLGELTIPYTGDFDAVYSADMSINLIVVDATVATVATDLDGNTITAVVFLPAADNYGATIAYAEGDNIQIQVNMKVPLYCAITEFSGVEGVTEAAFPEFFDLSNLPVANAGADQTVYAGDVVTLDGALSSDDVGIVSFVWTYDCDGIATVIGEDITATASFATEGDYVVTLTVTDGDGLTDIDTVLITVLPLPEDIVPTETI